VKESKALRPRRFDLPGQLLIMTFFGAVTFGIIEGPGRGWSSAPIVATLVLAVAALIAFVLAERSRDVPLVDLRFFQSIPFAGAVGIAVLSFAAFSGFLFLTTLYLQQVRGLSAVDAGLATVPVAVMIVAVSPFAGRVVGKRGARRPLLAAGIATVTACLVLAGAGPDTSFVWLVLAYVIFGIGVGSVNAPITDTAVAGMPREQAGVAAAMATTSRQFGQTLGVAIVGTVVASHGTRADLSSAIQLGWWALAALGLVVLILGFTATTLRAEESAQRTARQLNPDAVAAQP
jgi:Na+/melibiose symporter-like transporter